jgi:hypothetical protein
LRWIYSDLLIDVRLAAGSPVLELVLLEPETDLASSGLGGIRAVDDVATNINTEVTTDGTGGSSQRVGGTDKETRRSNDALTLPNLQKMKKNTE